MRFFAIAAIAGTTFALRLKTEQSDIGSAMDNKF
jgi:hypothetical protein